MEWLRRLFGSERRTAPAEAPRRRSRADGGAASAGRGFGALDQAERAAEEARRVRELIQARRPATAGTLPADEIAALAEIEALARAGQKIEAIRRYRQLRPGFGLKEAKDEIEGLMRGQALTGAGPARAALLAEVAGLLRAVCDDAAIRRYQREYPSADPVAARAGVAALEWGLRHPGAPVVPPGEAPEVVTLVRAGHRILAIKAYRERHPGLGLPEASAAIEALEREVGPAVGVSASALGALEREGAQRRQELEAERQRQTLAAEAERQRQVLDAEADRQRQALNAETQRRIEEHQAEVQRRAQELEAERQRLLREQEEAAAAKAQQARQAYEAAVAATGERPATMAEAERQAMAAEVQRARQAVEAELRQRATVDQGGVAQSPAGPTGAPAAPPAIPDDVSAALPAGPADAPVVPAEVEELVRAGRTIEAAMAYRRHFPQAGLGEAMDAVGALERRLKG